jgi:hypothetical protein
MRRSKKNEAKVFGVRWQSAAATPLLLFSKAAWRFASRAVQEGLVAASRLCAFELKNIMTNV